MCPHCKAEKAKIVKRRWPDGRFDWMCHACGRQVSEEQAGGEVALYDRMVLAINECHRTDQVKEIRDKALALGYYSRQAQNVEAERKAIEIRIRAERKAGELLSEMEKGKGGRPENSPHAALSFSEYAKAKEDGKISDDQAVRWQQLADIPEEEFEQALSDPDTKPSTSGIIKEEKKPPFYLKPVIDLPPPKTLDDNPRYCHASCCNGETEVRGPWGPHDAQSLLDEKSFPCGYFGKDHKAVLDLLVEVDQRHAIAQLHGGLGRSAIEGIRERRYRGIGQEKNSVEG